MCVGRTERKEKGQVPVHLSLGIQFAIAEANLWVKSAPENPLL
jgi:hypothetical protein